MSLRTHAGVNQRSINRSIRENGFTKVRQENAQSVNAKRRIDIEKYDSNLDISDRESQKSNATLASQAAMAVIFAKTQEKPIPKKSETPRLIKKSPSVKQSKSININQNARSKVDQIYKKQTLSPDVVYKHKQKPTPAIRRDSRLQDTAAKASLYNSSNQHTHRSPLKMRQNSLTHERFPQTQLKTSAAPIVSTLAANKALVEFTHYEKQQNLKKIDMINKVKREQEEMQNAERADSLKKEDSIDINDPSIQKKLKKASVINKATSDLVTGIINSHEFGSHHQEFDDLINLNSFASEDENSISDQSQVSERATLDRIKFSKNSNSNTSMQSSRKFRIPPPQMSSLFPNQFDPQQRSVSELTYSSNEVLPIDFPQTPKMNKLQFTTDALEKRNTSCKRSSSVSTDCASLEKQVKARGHRSNTISTLFHNIITSSNNASPLASPAQEGLQHKKFVSFSPNTTAESLTNSETSFNKGGSTNLFKRTMRSLSLSKKPTDVAKHIDGNDESQKTTCNAKKENKNIPRVEYSVLHKNLLPSYYKNEDGAVSTNVDASKGNIQFRTTLRDNIKKKDESGNTDSKHKGIMSKFKIGHFGHKHDGSAKSLKKPGLNSSTSYLGSKGPADPRRTDHVLSRFSDSEFTDSDSDEFSSHVITDAESANHSMASPTKNKRSFDGKRLSFSSFQSDMHDYDEDLQKYNKAKKDENKIKHNISGGGKKSDMFIKIPAKLAYKTMKKKTDNWEFRKNPAIKNVLKHEDSTTTIKANDMEVIKSDPTDSVVSGTINNSSSIILSETRALDDLPSQRNNLNESSYIIGVHSKSKNKKKFDENKPWKSHLDVGYITNDEKKRYEAIWVSNKNRYLEMLPWYDDRHNMGAVSSRDNSLTASYLENQDEDTATYEDYNDDEEDLMVNFVVYEIYNRSNLPPKVLKRIYDLVDKRRDGTLNKQSFIVGMWLIDQCLYGKKLPHEIPDLVWTSVDKMIIGVDISHKSLLRNKKKIARQEIKDLKKHEKVVKENNKKEQQQLPQQAN